MLLHTLHAPPDSPPFRDCLALAADGDAVLLLGDGVYAALEGSAACDQLRACPATLYYLDEDAAARGVGAGLWTGVAPLDMDGFVKLTEQFQRQMAWY